MKIRLTLILMLAAIAAIAAHAAPVTPFPNRALQCAEPGGVASYLTVASSPDLWLGSRFTIEAWVRADPNQTSSAFPIVLSRPAGNLLNGECSYGFIVARSSGNLTFRIQTISGSFNVTWAGNLLDGAWHHIAGVRADDEARLYVDGSLVTQLPVSGSTSSSSEALGIGGIRFAGYEGNGLVGQVDEVRLWNVARTPSELEGARFRAVNAAPGLVAAWHFDEWYPEPSGNRRMLDSVRERAADWNGLAGLTLQAPAIGRGAGFAVLEVMGQLDYHGPRTATGVVRIAGDRDVVYRQLIGRENSGNGELQVIGFTSSPRLLGSLALPAETPVTAMAAREDVVFCLKSVGTAYRLFPVSVSDPTQPALFGDSLTMKTGARLLVDPGASNQLVSAGASGGENWIGFVDATQAAAPVALLEADLGPTASLGTILDVAKRGPYLYATFSDGTLRTYRYNVFTINGQTVRTVDPAGTPLALGAAGRLAMSGVRLFVAGADGLLRVFDLASPTAPALLGAANVAPAFATGIQLDGDRAAIAGPNGVHLVNVADPASMWVTASYCADLPAAGSPSVSFGGNFVGLTASLGGYTQLVESSALAVAPREVARPAALVAGPNPAREQVWFAIPQGLARGSRLEVFDVTGRLVREWREVEDAREGRWIWDGTDASGARVRSGVYLARLSGGSEARTARVAIVR